MPEEWVPMSRDYLEHQIIEPLKTLTDAFAKTSMIMAEHGMKEHLTLLAQSHVDWINKIAGISLAVLTEMPDQAYCHTQGIKCRILRTREKNANDKKARERRAKTAPADGAQPVAEPPVKKKKGAK